MNTQEMQKVLKWVWIVLIILAVFLGVRVLSGLRDLRTTDPAYNSITVSGEGEAFSIPDIATFSFTVSVDAPTVIEAQGDVTKKMDAILSELSNIGIEDKDVKTTDYSVYPKYTYTQTVCTLSYPSYCPPGNQKQDGYTANHSVMVKVRQVDDAGKALSVVGDKGATGLSGISFTLDDPDKVTTEARALAVANAREKAKVLAKELRVKLVRVVSFSDNTDGGPMPYYQAMGGDSAISSVKAPTLPIGENKTKVVVSVTYEIR